MGLHDDQIAAEADVLSVYIIWSVKLSAWWGQTATYTSDFKAAKQFTKEKAIAFCKARFNGQLGDQGMNCVPVEFDLAVAIMEPRA